MRLYLTRVGVVLWSLDDNGTWDLVPLPTGKKVIGCRSVFAVKFNLDGFVARLKTRLVAKGYAQIYDVDYSNTFHLWLSCHMFVCLFLLLLLMIETCINLISRMPFYMEIFRKKFTWSNLRER